MKNISKNLTTFLTAFALAVTIWILAINASDPVDTRTCPQGIPIELTGLGSDLVITSDIPEQVVISLSAPTSLWESLLDNPSLIRASIDLTELQEGLHSLNVLVEVDAKPVKVETIGPINVEVVIEELFRKAYPITLVRPSPPAVGYEAGEAELSDVIAEVSGPASEMSKVSEVRAIIDISQADQNIDRNIELKAYDKNGLLIEKVFIDPERINVKIPVTQRGGYRNVTVKAIVTGQVAAGYRLTNISVSPLTVTVYSSDPQFVNELPGFVETQPLNINGADEDIKESLPLDLPAGISVVGESTISVSVTVSPIQGSLTINNSTIEVIGLNPEYIVSFAPEVVDVYLSGPLPTLDDLVTGDVRVILDLTDLEPGTYQIEPKVELGIEELLVESILPASIEVTIKIPPTPTPGN